MEYSMVTNKNGVSIPSPIEKAFKKKVRDLVEEKGFDVSDDYIEEKTKKMLDMDLEMQLGDMVRTISAEIDADMEMERG